MWQVLSMRPRFTFYCKDSIELNSHVLLLELKSIIINHFYRVKKSAISQSRDHCVAWRHNPAPFSISYPIATDQELMTLTHCRFAPSVFILGLLLRKRCILTWNSVPQPSTTARDVTFIDLQVCPSPVTEAFYATTWHIGSNDHNHCY